MSISSALVLSACSSHIAWTGPLAVFPSAAPAAATVLPMRDALLGPDLSVRAQLGGNSSRQSWMLLDSGTTAVFLPQTFAEQLKLEPFARVTINGAQDRRHRAEAVMIPELALGSLQLTNVVAAIGGRDALIGQSVLSHSPWEIDWDRGLVTLGASVWSNDTPDLHTVALRRSTTGSVDIVTLRIDGRAVDFVLDTGAQVSALPADRKYEGDTWLGDLHLGRTSFHALAPGRGPLGLLGLDLLTRFHFQVIPAERLLLRPRQSPWQTARERVARWPWTATCSNPACIRASVTEAADTTTLSLDLERPFPESAQLLLGCAGDTHDVPSVATIFAQGGSIRGTFNHIRVLIASGTSGKLQVPVQPPGTAWFRRPDSCQELAALELVPLGNERLAEPAIATLAL